MKLIPPVKQLIALLKQLMAPAKQLMAPLKQLMAPCRRASRLIPSLMIVCLLNACADYEFRVNERVVYTPLPLFSGFTIADSALHDCLVQTIKDKKVVRVQDLTELRCSHAGIASLDGLDIFAALAWLDLSHNDLVDISPLQGLTRLEMVDLTHNQLQDISELNFLPRLTLVKLSDNPTLVCRQGRALAADSDVRVNLPAHCKPAD